MFITRVLKSDKLMSNISLEAWKSVKQIQQKYDYFILGLSSALFAYLGAKFEPEAFSFSQNSFEIFALVFFANSILFGIMRLESDIAVQSNDLRQAQAQEKLDVVNKILASPYRNINLDTGNETSKAEALKSKQILSEFIYSINEHGKELANNYTFKFKVRNYSLYFGFILLIFSKFIGIFQAQ